MYLPKWVVVIDTQSHGLWNDEPVGEQKPVGADDRPPTHTELTGDPAVSSTTMSFVCVAAFLLNNNSL